MKKMILFACLLAQAAFADPMPSHHVIKRSNLPPALQYAPPNSYKEFLENHTIQFKLQLPKSATQAGPGDDYILTNNAFDFALLNPGYMVSRTNYGPLTYVFTRFGSTMLDYNGRLITRVGSVIQNSLFDIGSGNALNLDLQLPNPILTPSPTTYVTLQGNLNDAIQLGAYAFDSRGNTHFFEIHIAPSAINKYSISFINLEDDSIAASGAIYFDKKGLFSHQEGLDSIIIPSKDGSAEPVKFDIFFGDQVTNYLNLGTTIRIEDIDGFSAGELSSIIITEDGVLTVFYTNGVAVAAGRIAIAKPRNEDLEYYAPYSNFWTSKTNPHTQPKYYYDVRFLDGYLEKSALDTEEM